MLLTLFLPALERIINRAISCDPEALKKLSKIDNQVIKIHCTDWQFQFFMVINHQQILFHTRYFSAENTLITSTLNHFLHVFVKGANTKTLFDYPMDIAGNMHNLEILREIFTQLDLDLEEKLSQVIGDVAAHKMFSHARQSLKTAHTVSDKMQNQIKEYIYFEARHFPTQKQVEKFYQDIAILRDDVERLEKKYLI
jgi:ubiquinone biosynthesis protein UbiJ